MTATGPSGTLYLDGEKIADVTDIRSVSPSFDPPDWYPRRNVSGSTPFVNVRGCWFCGTKIEPLNGMCEQCAEKRPWAQPNAFIVTTFMQVLHSQHPDWWLHYIGGPHACIGCGASDNVGAIEHNNGCPVVAVIAQLERPAEEGLKS